MEKAPRVSVLDEPNKPQFKVGDVLVGTYMIGYNFRYAFFKVVSISKSGGPRVMELVHHVVSRHSTPSDSTTVVAPHPEMAVKENAAIVTARWGKKDKSWGAVVETLPFPSTDKKRATLDLYDAGKVYNEESYY